MYNSRGSLKICLLLTGVLCEMLLNGYSWCVCDLTEAVCVRFTGKTAEWEWCSFKTWWMTDQNPSCRITSFLCIFKSRFQNKLLFCSLVGDSDNSATRDIIARGSNPGIIGQGREHLFKELLRNLRRDNKLYSSIRGLCEMKIALQRNYKS